MKDRGPALILLAVQLLLVLSVAGVYLYERKVCPRVWARAAQFDPDQPLRGRYLSLQLLLDACALPRDQAHYLPGYPSPVTHAGSGSWSWPVSLDLSDGYLLPHLRDGLAYKRGVYQLRLNEGRPCDRASLSSAEAFFIPEHAKSPWPLPGGNELWVEVTVPPSGPPRPIQLAVSGPSGFHPIVFE